jgi:uncharacterized iron-regulated membrane protein
VKRLLFWIHRWTGVVLALFMLIWFASGFVIMYSAQLNQDRLQQLAHAEVLRPESGWLSLGEAWERSAAERKAEKVEPHRGHGMGAGHGHGAAAKTVSGGGRSVANPDVIIDARLVRKAGLPLWLIENGLGNRFAVSAIDGSLHKVSSEEAVRIASKWLEVDGKDHNSVAYLGTFATDSTLRNQGSWSPFHRIAVDDSAGTELLISARTGEVLRVSTRFERVLYYVGNWIHLLRFVDVVSPGETRHTVQMWIGFGAALACLTGIINGWLRWRPGWFGRPTYSQGRTQPYRDFWWKWHFWGGLIGGVFALLWGLSGYLSTNPWQIFSNPNPTREQLARYVGGEIPRVMREWKPAPIAEADEDEGVVELGWHRLGNEAILLAYTPDGRRLSQAVPGAVLRFSESALLDAARRLIGQDAVATQDVQRDYDSYYYPRRGRGTWDRQLPVSRVAFDDDAASRVYIDPVDGRLLIKQDTSRRVYRWAFNLLHHWDFGWLNTRPVRDVWMIVWVTLGLVISGTSVVLAWKRLQVTFRSKKRVRSNGPVARPSTAETVGS